MPLDQTALQLLGDQSFWLSPTLKFSKMEREALRGEKVMGQIHSLTVPLLNVFAVRMYSPFQKNIYKGFVLIPPFSASKLKKEGSAIAICEIYGWKPCKS